MNSSDPPKSALGGGEKSHKSAFSAIYCWDTLAPIHKGGFSAHQVGINHFMKIRIAGLLMTLCNVYNVCATVMGVDVMQK